MGKVIETSFDNFYDKFDQTEFQGPWENAVNEKKKTRKTRIFCFIITPFLRIDLSQNKNA